jgi:hypothetical protein
MKRNSRFKNKMTQFSYDHKNIRLQLVRATKSAEELSRLLDKMTTKEKKEEKN